MSSLFTTQEQEALNAPHVTRAWFLELDHPDGTKRYHNGYGDLSLPLPSGGDPVDWIGVSNPFTNVVSVIGQVEDPRFGSAPTVSVVLTGVSSAFMKQWKDDARDIEGRSATVYWAAVDPESPNPDGLITSLKPLFPGGKVTAPRLTRTVSMNFISLTVESFFHAQNFPGGEMWSDAGQQRRFPGDLGLSEMGTIVVATRRS